MNLRDKRLLYIALINQYEPTDGKYRTSLSHPTLLLSKRAKTKQCDL